MESITIEWHEGEINLDVDVIGIAADPTVGLIADWDYEDVYYNGRLVENIRPEVYPLITEALTKGKL